MSTSSQPETRDPGPETPLWPRSRMADLADWLGVPLSDRQHEQLEAYGQWLASEAVAAGGIGPREVDRLFDRHVGDALTYLSLVPPATVTLVDVGSGVGLPGIPLAIARPTLAVTLVDRSGRRTDLARRAMRVTGVRTASPVMVDVRDLRDTFEVAVFRASLPPIDAVGVASQILTADGTGLVGVSRRPERPQVPVPGTGLTTELVRMEPPMLDSPVWLLRMQRSAE